MLQTLNSQVHVVCIVPVVFSVILYSCNLVQHILSVKALVGLLRYCAPTIWVDIRPGTEE